MRKFLLENELGQRFDFQDYENSLSYALQGLGFKFDASYSKLGEYYVANTRSLSQKAISFNCLFQDSLRYTNFINFISFAESLKLVYINDENMNEIFIDIDISRVEKATNLKLTQVIATVEVVNKSLFYSRRESAYELDYSTIENRWPMRFPVRFTDDINGVIEVNAQGNSECAYRLEIFGECLNPSIEIIDRDNVSYTVTFNIEIELGQKLVYSTVDNDLRIELVSGNGDVENVFSCLDFKAENFKKLKVGYNRIIANDFTKAKLVLFDTYVSV